MLKDPDHNKFRSVTEKGVKYEADGLFTQDGVLKIPDNVDVTVKFDKNGGYTITAINKKSTYYPIAKGPSSTFPYNGTVSIPLPTPNPTKTNAGDKNPFDMNNPLDPLDDKHFKKEKVERMHRH